MVGAIFEWYWGLALFLFAMFCVWIGVMFSTPYKQRNEARQRIHELEQANIRPNLFNVLCPTTSFGIPINKLQDGSFRASPSYLGFKPLSLVHHGELTTVTRFTMSPMITFVKQGKGWESTDAIQVLPMQNPLASPRAKDFSWDIQNQQLWVLTGLPLVMGKDEIQILPMIGLAVGDANKAGSQFENWDSCVLTMKFAIRTDKGNPLLANQQITLTKSDIKEHYSRFEGGSEK